MEAFAIRRAFDQTPKKARGSSKVYTSLKEVSLKSERLAGQTIKRPGSFLRDQCILTDSVIGRTEFRRASPRLKSWVVQLCVRDSLQGSTPSKQKARYNLIGQCDLQLFCARYHIRRAH